MRGILIIISFIEAFYCLYNYELSLKSSITVRTITWARFVAVRPSNGTEQSSRGQLLRLCKRYWTLPDLILPSACALSAGSKKARLGFQAFFLRVTVCQSLFVSCRVCPTNCGPRAWMHPLLRWSCRKLRVLTRLRDRPLVEKKFPCRL